MSHTYDIAVAWRIYPRVSKVPILYAGDKFRMVRTSLLSFKESAEGLKISYYFLLDGCPPEYTALLQELFAGEKMVIIDTPSLGNLNTFAKQIEILTKQDDAELVYFAEDDYLYRPGLFKNIYELVRNKEADFASAYLHNDVFTHPIHRHKRMVKYSGGQFWLSANSTCLTFLTSKATLLETKNVFLTYQKGNNDCALWLVLTKTHIFNPFAWLRFMGDKECFGILKMSVKYSFNYYFTTRRYSLWMPYTAICTHLEKGSESPGTDWLAVAKRIEEKDPAK